MESTLIAAGTLALLVAAVAVGVAIRAAGHHDRIVALSADLARANAAAEEVPALKAERDEERRRATRLAEQLARTAAELEAERSAARVRAAEAERSREQVRAEVELLAGRLLDEKGAAVLHQNREGLRAILDPVALKLRELEARIEATYAQENRDRASLLASLERLQQAQSRLHDDAEALARALTGDSKAQGDWGELVLERVLETAGLAEGREYELQVTRVDESGGRKRPDALVYLPGNRAVVVDAKCSLTAFVQAMRAGPGPDRDRALDAHVASVRGHVRALAGKAYPEAVGGRTLDIVLLFVPSEAAFHAAIARDAGLYDDAFRHRIVICSPTTLLAALQLIAHVWRSERQNASARRIADEAGKLVEKIAAFVEDLDALGSRLAQAQASYDAARGKLVAGRGNILKRASDLVKLGARVRPDRIEPLLVDGDEPDGALESVAPGAPALEPGDTTDPR